MLPVLAPAGLYLLACMVTIAGLSWLEERGQIGTRVLVFTMVLALLGLPVVVGAGMILGIRRSERRA